MSSALGNQPSKDNDFVYRENTVTSPPDSNPLQSSLYSSSISSRRVL